MKDSLVSNRILTFCQPWSKTHQPKTKQKRKQKKTKNKKLQQQQPEGGGWGWGWGGIAKSQLSVPQVMDNLRNLWVRDVHVTDYEISVILSL